MRNIIYYILMSILFCFVMIWVALVWVVETCCDLIEKGTQRIKNFLYEH